MATKIENKGNKIIFTGHEENKKQCELTTLLCNALANSKDFKTIRYENGYAEFEKIGSTNELKFAGPIPYDITVNGENFAIVRTQDDINTTWEIDASANTSLYSIDNNLVIWKDGTILQYNGVDVLPTDYIHSGAAYTTRAATTTPSPTINLSNLARFKSKLDATYMDINGVAANPGSYTAILSTITILGKNYNILPQASSMALGGIKIGYPQSGKNYPVQLSSSGQAYVNVPWTDADVTSQKIFDLTEDSDTVVREIDSKTNKVNIHLATTIANKVNNALQMPTTQPTELLIVGLNKNKAQTNIPLGSSLALENGHLETAIKIVKKTQTEYDALTSYDANTMYVIVG